MWMDTWMRSKYLYGCLYVWLLSYVGVVLSKSNLKACGVSMLTYRSVLRFLVAFINSFKIKIGVSLSGIVKNMCQSGNWMILANLLKNKS